jgi:heme-degrading monooxygenase HmoA
MVKVLARLAVEDFGVWKDSYESGEASRQQYGCHGTQIFRHADGLNEVVLVQEWDSLESQKRFVAESNLQGDMKRGGSSLKEINVLSSF